MPKNGLIFAALIACLGLSGFFLLGYKAVSSKEICALHRIEVSQGNASIECFDRNPSREEVEPIAEKAEN